ncbi:MAG: hypothetical protein JW770_05345 [Actinobacteria bacterium]|nr:hypothetical protein [Actinomycetota bacterium]
MKKLMKISNNTTLILGSVSTAGLILSNIFFVILRNTIINMGDVSGTLRIFELPVASAYIVSGFFHLSAILTLILQLYFFKRDNFLRAFLFFSGITSFLMLFGDFALMGDISKEYIFGLPGEFTILFFSQALHLIFYILMITLIVLTKKSAAANREEIVLKDDSIFINAQYIGILSGISGLSLIVIFSLLYSTVYPLPGWALKAGIVVTSVIAVVPYVLIILYWLIIRIREKITEWYDEKQYQDLTRSSLIALIASLIFLFIIFILQYVMKNFGLLNLIWFPLYFFFILLLFSATTLFFNKRAG